MGYSISIRPRTKALKNKMLAFMEKNYRLPHDVFHELFPSITDDYSQFSDDLSYDHGRWTLGFDYNACEPERDYIFAVTRWMALKVGRERTFKLEKIGKVTVPFYVYDGYEPTPILIETVWKDKIPKSQGWRLTDEVGFKSWDTRWLGVPRLTKPDGSLIPELVAEMAGHQTAHLDGVSPYKCYEKIHEELKRLDNLWNDDGSRMHPCDTCPHKSETDIPKSELTKRNDSVREELTAISKICFGDETHANELMRHCRYARYLSEVKEPHDNSKS